MSKNCKNDQYSKIYVLKVFQKNLLTRYRVMALEMSIFTNVRSFRFISWKLKELDKKCKLQKWSVWRNLCTVKTLQFFYNNDKVIGPPNFLICCQTWQIWLHIVSHCSLLEILLPIRLPGERYRLLGASSFTFCRYEIL